MLILAHAVALTCYVGAALAAALPFVRPMNAPRRVVLAILGTGVLAHLAGLIGFRVLTGQLPVSGLGPSLSTAGFLLALSLLLVEWIARDVSLTLVAAPLAALPTFGAAVAGLQPGIDPSGARGVWMVSHVVLSFLGIAAFATAAAAGTMYLFQHRELRSRRFGAIFRVFPPLATLDRVNHVSSILGWLGLTVGVVLATSYSFAYQQLDVPKTAWAVAAWLAVSTIALGRTLGGWQARRAAILSSVSFFAIVVLYIAIRLVESGAGRFL